MKRIPFAAIVLVISGAQTALAAGAADENLSTDLRGAYVEFRGGAAFLEDSDTDANANLPTSIDFDTGYTAGAAIGYGFSDTRRYGSGPWNNIRIEAEVAYSENDLDAGGGNRELSTFAYMGNIYYDFPTGTKWTPFIGGGVGVARVEFDGAGLSDDDDTVLAYQARAGVAYQFSSNITGTLGYRFFDTLDPDLADSAGAGFDSEYRSHAIEVGLRLTF